jgi:hypothetical protein
MRQLHWNASFRHPLTLCALTLSALSSPLQGASILDLQPYREVSTATMDSDASSMRQVSLTNLNPYVGAWYVLSITPFDPKVAAGKSLRYTIENPFPADQLVSLDPRFADGLVLTGVQGITHCPLWPKDEASPLEVARATKVPYATLCGGKLFLLNETHGRVSAKEWGAAFLRDYVWGGEKITELVKDTIYQDSRLQKAEISKSQPTPTPTSSPGAPTTAIAATPTPVPAPTPPFTKLITPRAASIDKAYTGALLKPVEVGIKIPLPAGSEMRAGEWYPTVHNADVFVSAFSAKLVDSEILKTFPDRVKPLDTVETNALNYLIAFDLKQFEVGYLLGTEHPKVNWSPRASEKLRDNPLGPDGIDTITPIIPTGVLPPHLVTRAVSTFTSGFKREHGAFLYGPLSLTNKSSHYGWINNGVIFSTLQPGLATIVIRTDGNVEMRTWRAEDQLTLPTVLHARQNGVPIIDQDPVTKESKPGLYVGQWGPGNWSGSSEGRQRALRAAICLTENQGRKFLVYGYFSSVTPNAMARVFQAYNCSYAFHLDMNALEHTYLALYRDQTKNFSTEHLIPGMNVLDREYGGKIAPRFVAEPDNRDFFYILRKGKTP